jgi:hypothetical protein
LSLYTDLKPLILKNGKVVRLLAAAGLNDFDHVWNSPHNFVEPINGRRGGWSGVSILKVSDGIGGFSNFYLKRQENQHRYSWHYPFKELTFAHEVKALGLAALHDWPAVELAAFGFRRAGSSRQSIILTPEICLQPLSYYQQNLSELPESFDFLRRVGQQLLKIHRAGWRHGALFPAHMFVDAGTGELQLIDFERARNRYRPVNAASVDFIQLFKRSEWLPDAALNALLEAYRDVVPALIPRLQAQFPHRNLSL